jgi:hypothetical protein
MKARIVIESLAVTVTCLYGSSGVAQGLHYSQDVQLYAGQMFGDRITTTPINGSYPRLDDSVTFGGRYTFDFTPQWGRQFSTGYSPGRLSHYAVAGSGYAWSYLDHAIAGSVAGAAVTLNDGNDVTANDGLGARYYLYDGLFIDLDARYRYLNNLVSAYPQGLNTAETTISFGYQF